MAKAKTPKPKKTLAETLYGDKPEGEDEGPSCGHPRWWRLYSGKDAICLHDTCTPVWPPKFVDIKTGKPIRNPRSSS